MSERIDFLFLKEQDMITAGVKDMGACIRSMEDMFVLIHKGDYRMGGEDANEHGIRVSFPKSSDIDGMPLNRPDYRFMAMPAYLGGRFHMFGIKTYGSNPDNNKKGYPRSVLMMSLMDAETGVPLAYMSANILSAMRTGAVAGVGAKHLTKNNATTVAIIGPGTMSRYAMKSFLVTQQGIKTVKIKGRSDKSMEQFIAFCKEKFPGIEKYEVCNTIEEVCKNSDIVFCGTTNASKYEDNPGIKLAWLKKGALVISVSALLADTELLSAPNVKLIADNYKMYDGWGTGQPLPTQKNVSTLLGMGFYDAVTEGRIPRERIIDIGEVLCGGEKGRDDDEQIILYAVGGMPIEDVAWGYDVYERARKYHIGIQLNLWEESQL